MKTLSIPFPRTTVIAAVLAAAAALAGCVTTGGIAPKAQTVDFQTLAPQAVSSAKIDDTWWQAFGDPQLDALVARGLSTSPNLAVVRVRLERAQAQVNEADAQRQPRVDANASVERQRYTANTYFPPGIAGTSKSDGSVGVTGSWELDVFGKRRAELDAAIGSKRAADADFEAARVLLSSSIVRQYVQLAHLTDQHEILARSLAQRQEILALVRQRVEAGLDTGVELRQGEGAIPEIRVALDGIDEQAEITRHVLAELTGQGPDALRDFSPKLATVDAVPMPSNVPADLLGRRADIVAARWRVESAGHELDAAHAEFYPSVNLLAFADFSAIGLNNLFKAGSREYGVGPALSLPIFDAGRLRANYKAKATDVDSAVDSYNAAVLAALHETADALSSLRHAEVQRGEQGEALDRANRAYELALERYRGGLTTYLTVLTAETNVLAQRRIDSDFKAKSLDVQAQLARALGGGYVQTDEAPLSKNLATTHNLTQEHQS